MEWSQIVSAEAAGSLPGSVKYMDQAHRVHVVPDLHYPFQDDDAVHAIMDAARGAQTIVLIGDGVDCYSISSFDRDPARKVTLQSEADAYRVGFLEPLRQANPHARIIQILGNHENRLIKFLRKKAPELHDMRSLSWRSILHADAIGMEIVPSSGLLLFGHRLKHGDKVRSGAGLTARAEMEDHRCDGVSAHTHRYGRASRKDKEGRVTNWWEIGHACDVSQVEYVDNPDWNLSAGLGIEVFADGRIEYTEHRL
jgi:UDP-2,3-diacylglucosamine pyrophosphatase LpxH